MAQKATLNIHTIAKVACNMYVSVRFFYPLTLSLSLSHVPSFTHIYSFAFTWDFPQLVPATLLFISQ